MTVNQHQNILRLKRQELESIENTIYQNKFTSLDVEMAIKKLKNNKAVGLDFISNEMLKYSKSQRLYTILSTIFNDVVKYGLILQNFNVSLIHPIPKTKTFRDKPDEYRPISVSNILCNVYEQVILIKTHSTFKFNKRQFGYSAASSCKQSSFLVNEVINYYKRGNSPIYILSLDTKKAFDRMWREGAYYKLIGKIDKSLWRAIVNYYSNSMGVVKYNGELSDIFSIIQGVKQGGIISPYFFNFFINDLLDECDNESLGARLGNIKLSIISYCDDLLIMSPLINDANKILNKCHDFAKKWKFVFNAKKCNWYVAGNQSYNNPTFKLGSSTLQKVNSLIHLGMPVGSKKYVEEFFCQKFRKGECSLYSLYGFGCNDKGLAYNIIGDIYKRFCQSTFYYGLETNYISEKILRYIDIRQNTLLKNTFSLSKYARSKPLLSALRIKSIKHLYEEYKIILLKQIRTHCLTRDVFIYLFNYYNTNEISRESYIYTIKTLFEKLEILANDINDYLYTDIKYVRNILDNKYILHDDGLADSIKWLITRNSNQSMNNFDRKLIEQLLYIQFNSQNNIRNNDNTEIIININTQN